MKNQTLLNKIVLAANRIILVTSLLTLHTQSYTAAKNSSTISDDDSNEFPVLDETKTKLNKIANSCVLICIHQAIKNGQCDLVRNILEAHPTLRDQKDHAGQNLLHIALKNKQPDIAKQLMTEYPALLNQKNKRGWAPLHSAAKYGHFEITQSIIEKNPETITQKTNSGSTPFHLAAAYGHIAIVEYILTKNPDSYKQQDALKQTPLHMAAASQHLDIVEFLLQKCESIDIRVQKKGGPNILNVTPINKKEELTNLLKKHLLRLHIANPDEQHLKCGICLKTATECSDCEDIADPLERIGLAPCCLKVLCEHDFAHCIALQDPSCPYCREAWILP